MEIEVEEHIVKLRRSFPRPLNERIAIVSLELVACLVGEAVRDLRGVQANALWAPSRKHWRTDSPPLYSNSRFTLIWALVNTCQAGPLGKSGIVIFIIPPFSSHSVDLTGSTLGDNTRAELKLSENYCCPKIWSEKKIEMKKMFTAQCDSVCKNESCSLLFIIENAICTLITKAPHKRNQDTKCTNVFLNQNWTKFPVSLRIRIPVSLRAQKPRFQYYHFNNITVSVLSMFQRY